MFFDAWATNINDFFSDCSALKTGPPFSHATRIGSITIPSAPASIRAEVNEPMRGSTGFEYDALATATSIRLLEIGPLDIQDAKICCTLRAYDLADSPAYQALSYI